LIKLSVDEDFYVKIAGAVGGDDAIGVVSQIIQLRSATDEEIASHSGLRLPSVRRVLYRLLELNLVRYEERRDEVTQKVSFLWSPAIDQVEGYVSNLRKIILGKLLSKLEFITTHEIYRCTKDPNHGSRPSPNSYSWLTFEESVEFFFKCPVCGGQLEPVNTREFKNKLEEKINSIKEEIATVFKQS